MKTLINEYNGTVKLNPDDSSLNLSHSLQTKNERISTAFQILGQLSPENADVPELVASV